MYRPQPVKTDKAIARLTQEVEARQDAAEKLQQSGTALFALSEASVCVVIAEVLFLAEMYFCC